MSPEGAQKRPGAEKGRARLREATQTQQNLITERRAPQKHRWSQQKMHERKQQTTTKAKTRLEHLEFSTNERTNERTNEQTNRRPSDERTNEKANERTHERTNGRTNERTNERTIERTNERASDRTTERTNERMNE